MRSNLQAAREAPAWAHQLTSDIVREIDAIPVDALAAMIAAQAQTIAILQQRVSALENG